MSGINIIRLRFGDILGYHGLTSTTPVDERRWMVLTHVDHLVTMLSVGTFPGSIHSITFEMVDDLYCIVESSPL